MDFFCNICYFNRFLVIEESYLGIFRKFSDPYGKSFRWLRKKNIPAMTITVDNDPYLFY